MYVQQGVYFIIVINDNFDLLLINTLDGFKSLIGQNPVTCGSVNGGKKTGFGK